MYARVLGLGLAILLTAGCTGGGGASGGSAGSGGGLSGVVADAAVAGAEVRLFRILPDGRVGEPRETAAGFPLPPPVPLAVTRADARGHFRFDGDFRGPFLVSASGGVFRDSATGEVLTVPASAPLSGVVVLGGTGQASVSPLTTIASFRALRLIRAGTTPEAAVAQAVREVGEYFRVADEPVPGSRHLAVLEAMARYASLQGMNLAGFTHAAARDAADGRFDGRDGSRPLRVLARSGSEHPLLPADAFTTGVQARSAALATSTGVVGPTPAQYVSPYSLQFTNSLASLTSDFATAPRNSIPDEAATPAFADWYATSAYPTDELPWGPSPALYPVPTIPDGADPVAWQQERVLAVAQSRIGTDYQHHHIPDWDPPAGWPAWLTVSLGQNGPGIDCSDFSSWNYNYGLGIRLQTGVATQAATTSLPGPGGAGPAVQAQALMQATSTAAQDYATFQQTLVTGDLLYIRANADSAPGTDISHVIMWMGSVGQGSSVPLVLDSHDNSPPVYDSNGVLIPAGVQLRPFLEGSWYHRAFDHAHRIVQ